MDIKEEISGLLEHTLGLKGRADRFTLDTPLLGSLPELDSMAIVSLITSLEEHFGFTIEDDEISADTFLTLGTLVAYVQYKLDESC